MRTCDCLVHPYRGEGFGLPLAEAMACGLPIVVTGHGAALDFCDESNAYLIPARETRFEEARVDGMATVDRPRLAEPDGPALCALLRHVAEHPAEAREQARRAAAHARQHLTWDHTARAVEARLQALTRLPVRRAAGRAVPASGAGVARSQRVSLCLIVRDEAENLPGCLGGLRELFHEVIVVDTGSTDATKEVAAALGARVFDFPWQDSFSAARNESLRHATGDWVFWMDADDRLDGTNRRRLRELLAALGDENAAYVMKCRCLPGRPGGTVTVVDHVRLFRNDAHVRWTYRVHEQILPALRAAGADVRWAGVCVDHLGYADPALRRKKLGRDLRLLRLEVAEQPDDPFTLFNLGQVTLDLGNPGEAIPLLRRSLAGSDPGASIVRKLYALLADCHRALGQPAEALACCRAGRAPYPDDAELLYTEGELLLGLGDLAGAEECLLHLLGTTAGDHFASVDSDLRGYRGRHLLARACQRQGRHEPALVQWQRVTAERPDFLPGWRGLGESALALGDWETLEQAARSAEGLPGGGPEADRLRARGLSARGEFEDRQGGTSPVQGKADANEASPSERAEPGAQGDTSG